jgi:hypothetical protein
MTATDARVQSTVERQARPTTTLDPWRAPRDGVDRDQSRSVETTNLVEHELRRFPLSVVSRWAVTLALTTVIAWWTAIGVLWLAADAFGLTGDVESLAREVGFEGFRLASGPVFLALGVLGAAWVVAVTLVAVFVAAVYNLYAAVLGGIRVEAIERVVRGEDVIEPTTSEPIPLPVD